MLLRSLCRRFSSPAAAASGPSINPEEVRKFTALSERWWHPDGPCKQLHLMNPVRVGYIRDTLAAHTPPKDASLPFVNLRMLDVGCGGGILSESLRRLGGEVTGIDAAESSIGVARNHAPYLGVTYEHKTAEQVADDGRQFDVVCALEILEHVTDPAAFVRTCVQLVKPGGWFFASTMNKTPLSYLLTIVMAESVLKYVPQGTHEYEKYIAPDDLQRMTANAGLSVTDVRGMGYNPLSERWFLFDSQHPLALQVNYILAAQKPSQSNPE